MKVLELIVSFLLCILKLFSKGSESKHNRSKCFMSEIKEGEKKHLKVVLKTAAGHPAKYQEGSAIWTSSDDSVVSVTPDPENELRAEIEGLDGTNNESVVITFSVDGDPDADETRDLIGTKSYVCTQGEAEIVELEEEDNPEAVSAEVTEEPAEVQTDPTGD